MTKDEMFDLMNKTMQMNLATVEGDQPHVRGVLLFRADENGIIFHTGTFKSLYKQIEANPKAEIVFFNGGTQIRVKGILKRDTNPALVEEIYNHPTRKFLHAWENIQEKLAVYRMTGCEAAVWTMETNLNPTEWIRITK